MLGKVLDDPLEVLLASVLELRTPGTYALTQPDRTVRHRLDKLGLTQADCRCPTPPKKHRQNDGLGPPTGSSIKWVGGHVSCGWDGKALS